MTVSIGFQIKTSPGLGGCVVFLGKTKLSFHIEV